VVSTDRLSLLQHARDRLVAELATAEGAAAAAVSRELRALLNEIDAIPTSGEVSDLDRLADSVSDDLADRRRRRAEAG
jgi:hypothetical protein